MALGLSQAPQHVDVAGAAEMVRQRPARFPRANRRHVFGQPRDALPHFVLPGGGGPQPVGCQRLIAQPARHTVAVIAGEQRRHAGLLHGVAAAAIVDVRHLAVVRHQAQDAGADVLAREAVRPGGLPRVHLERGPGGLIAERNRHQRTVAAVAVRFAPHPAHLFQRRQPVRQEALPEGRQVLRHGALKAARVPRDGGAHEQLGGERDAVVRLVEMLGTPVLVVPPARTRDVDRTVVPPRSHPLPEQLAELRPLGLGHGIVDPVVKQPLPAEMTPEARFLERGLPPQRQDLFGVRTAVPAEFPLDEPGEPRFHEGCGNAPLGFHPARTEPRRFQHGAVFGGEGAPGLGCHFAHHFRGNHHARVRRGQFLPLRSL